MLAGTTLASLPHWLPSNETKVFDYLGAMAIAPTIVMALDIKSNGGSY